MSDSEYFRRRADEEHAAAAAADGAAALIHKELALLYGKQGEKFAGTTPLAETGKPDPASQS